MFIRKKRAHRQNPVVIRPCIGHFRTVELPENNKPLKSDADAWTSETLLPLVYGELRKLAASRMQQESPGQTLQPTALVHEVYLRLGAEKEWNSQAHFFGAAAVAMRRILIEKARAKGRMKRSGELERVEAAKLDVAWETEAERLLALDEALTKLEARDALAAKLVGLRFFAGLPNHEAAAMLGLSERTAKRTWAYARAFLHREITGETTP